jgi:hypothetical protein
MIYNNDKQRLYVFVLGWLFIFCLITNSYAENLEKKDDIQVIRPYDMNKYDNDLQLLFNKIIVSSNLNTRIISATQGLLNKPYLLGALGEGKAGQFDQNPLYRSDAFDCETFIDTLLALVEAKNYQEFPRVLVKIRYYSENPHFFSRNHFTNIDWNSRNQHNKYLVDVTKTLFPTEFTTSKTVIDKPNWLRHLKASEIKLLNKPDEKKSKMLLMRLHALSNQAELKVSQLDYVPLAALYNKQGEPNKDLFARIPDGSVIEIVRPNWNLQDKIGTNLDISHMGIVIRIKGELLLFHASELKQKVISQPLTEYLQAYLKSPTVKGIHIEKIK